MHVRIHNVVIKIQAYCEIYVFFINSFITLFIYSGFQVFKIHCKNETRSIRELVCIRCEK